MGTLLKPFEYAVAWIMVQFHSLLVWLGMDSAGGWTWTLSIVGLVVVIRILLIPLFVKQIKASRGMQLLQPEVQKIQKKYKGKTDPASRDAMGREMMDLYKRTGTNPFSSCLPILLQMPIFFALFRVLNTNVVKQVAIGPLTQELAALADHSEIFGVALSDTFMNADGLNVKILTVILIILMSGSTFITQKQLMSQNMPAASMENNPFMQQQKIMLYLFPLIFAISGVNFPIGVLIYWLTTNLWSMGQQFFVIRRMPSPGSPAEARRNARLQARGKPVPGVATATVDKVEDSPRPSGQRQQPKRKDRQRKTPPASGPRPSNPGAGQKSQNPGPNLSKKKSGDPRNDSSTP